MEITYDRLKHSLRVAEKMKMLSIDDQEYRTLNPDEMFVLGFLHDIGYEFCDVQTQHAQIGGRILEQQGYKYWKEVYFHGIPQKSYNSLPLRLLNYVDMCTGPKGEDMTMQQRIEDIAARYGEESKQVKDAVALKEMLVDSY